MSCRGERRSRTNDSLAGRGVRIARVRNTQNIQDGALADGRKSGMGITAGIGRAGGNSAFDSERTKDALADPAVKSRCVRSISLTWLDSTPKDTATK